MGRLTKTEEIYIELRNAILNKEIVGNELITEQEVAEKYNVSKTPAREALGILCQEGYLTKYARTGYFLRNMTPKECIQIIEYRIVLESFVVKRIIEKCSDEEIESLYQLLKDKSANYITFNKINRRFHQAMAQLIGNEFIVDALIRIQNLNALNEGESYFNKIKDSLNVDHLKIVDALIARDTDTALALINQDLRQTDFNIFND